MNDEQHPVNGEQGRTYEIDTRQRAGKGRRSKRERHTAHHSKIQARQTKIFSVTQLLRLSTCCEQVAAEAAAGASADEVHGTKRLVCMRSKCRLRCGGNSSTVSRPLVKPISDEHSWGVSNCDRIGVFHRSSADIVRYRTCNVRTISFDSVSIQFSMTYSFESDPHY